MKTAYTTILSQTVAHRPRISIIMHQRSYRIAQQKGRYQHNDALEHSTHPPPHHQRCPFAIQHEPQQRALSNNKKKKNFKYIKYDYPHRCIILIPRPLIHCFSPPARPQRDMLFEAGMPLLSLWNAHSVRLCTIKNC